MSNTLSTLEAKDIARPAIDAASNAALAFANDVQDFVTTALVIPDLELNPPFIDVNAADYINSVIFASQPAKVILPKITATKPDEPTLTPIEIPVFGAVPELTLVAPVINIPAAPDASLPAAPSDAPEFNAPLIPDAPVFTMPAVPTFENVVLPTLPAYTIPAYTPVFPDDDITEVTSTFNFNEVEYQSDMLDDVRMKLINDLVNGGYGIDTADEQALWQRARERESLNAETAVQEATSAFAARGFPVPPGALLALIEGAQQQAMEKISSIGREIALKRADMYVENRKFTIQQAIAVEQMLITYFGYKMERALNVAKYTAQFGIDIFNTVVARYNARLEGTKVTAQVYETQLRAALAHLEAYKTEVEGARLSVEVQKLYADVYNTQLEGVKAYVNIYQTQMEAAKVYAQIEGLRLDAFRTQIDGYTALVGAKSAEFGMYKTRIEGETAKLDSYKVSVDAYNSQVAAYATSTSAKKTIVDAQTSVASLQLDTYKTQIAAYGEDLRASQLSLNSTLEKYRADVMLFKAFVDSSVSSTTAVIEIQKGNAQISLDRSRIASGHITATAQVLSSHDGLGAQASLGAMKSLTGLTTANAGTYSTLAFEPGT